MSYCPGTTLEALVEDNFYYDSEEELKKIIKFYEPYRELLEGRADNFDEDTMSWRDFNFSLWDAIPDYEKDK